MKLLRRTAQPGPRIEVRPVGPFDLGWLARLHKACFTDAWSRADLAHMLALPGGFGLLAKLNDPYLLGLHGLRGAGFALACITKDEAELLSIGVAPPFRRHAVGRALLQATIARCRAAGVRWLFLEVATDNVAAQKLYERFGFTVVGRREGYYARPNGARCAAFTMRCDLIDATTARDDTASPTAEL